MHLNLFNFIKVILLLLFKFFLSAIVHGALAIHLKVYPIIYLPSIFLFFLQFKQSDFAKNSLKISIYSLLTNQKGLIYVMVWFY